MISVFDYLDYRSFLVDFHKETQAKLPGFSVRAFLKKAGITSPSFFNQVATGKRNLSPAALDKFLNAMHLSQSESEFFRVLVQFNQAKTSSQKQSAYTQLLALGHSAQVKIIGKEYYEYYEHWYYPVVREILPMLAAPANPTLVAEYIQPNLTAKQAKKAIQFLLQHNYIQETNGHYSQTDPILHTGDAVQSLAIRAFNKQMTQLAQESLERFSIQQRHVRGITMSLSPHTYELICQEVNAFHQRILTLVHKEKNPTRVYQFNSMLFPVTEPIHNTTKVHKVPKETNINKLGSTEDNTQ